MLKKRKMEEEVYEYDKVRLIMAGIIIVLLIGIIMILIFFYRNEAFANKICARTKMIERMLIEVKDRQLLEMLTKINEQGYVDIGVGSGQVIRLAPVQVG